MEVEGCQPSAAAFMSARPCSNTGPIIFSLFNMIFSEFEQCSIVLSDKTLDFFFRSKFGPFLFPFRFFFEFLKTFLCRF